MGGGGGVLKTHTHTNSDPSQKERIIFQGPPPQITFGIGGSPEEKETIHEFIHCTPYD